MKPLLYFLIIFLSLRLQDDYLFSNRWTVWNVGQGQWSTFINAKRCHHIDMGGEAFPDSVIQECRYKKNSLSLSHWDLDHVSWIADFKKRVPFFCLQNMPVLAAPSMRKQKLIHGIKTCPDLEFDIQEIHWPMNLKNKDPNSLSRIYHTKKILIPGDSTEASEKIWVHSIRNSFSYLILGHHGSRTSTSELLLQKLPHLKQAISSSRYRKYKHPHYQTQYRLKKYRVPLLKTEDWGNITFFSFGIL